MPWNVSGVVEQRSRFLKDYDTGEYTLAELSRVYEISRQTAYNLLEGREQDGNELGCGIGVALRSGIPIRRRRGRSKSSWNCGEDIRAGGRESYWGVCSGTKGIFIGRWRAPLASCCGGKA